MEDLIQAFGLNWKLLLMQIINFAILLFVLQKFLYKPVVKMLEKRRKMVEAGVKDAKEAKVKLESAEEEKNQIISDSNQEASKIIDRAKKRSEVKGQEIVATAQERAESIKKNADLQAQEIQEKVMKETENQITQTAILAAEKIIAKKL